MHDLSDQTVRRTKWQFWIYYWIKLDENNDTCCTLDWASGFLKASRSFENTTRSTKTLFNLNAGRIENMLKGTLLQIALRPHTAAQCGAARFYSGLADCDAVCGFPGVENSCGTQLSLKNHTGKILKSNNAHAALQPSQILLNPKFFSPHCHSTHTVLFTLANSRGPQRNAVTMQKQSGSRYTSISAYSGPLALRSGNTSSTGEEGQWRANSIKPPKIKSVERKTAVFHQELKHWWMGLELKATHAHGLTLARPWTSACTMCKRFWKFVKNQYR